MGRVMGGSYCVVVVVLMVVEGFTSFVEAGGVPSVVFGVEIAADDDSCVLLGVMGDKVEIRVNEGFARGEVY